MATILVVDDSAVTLRLLNHVLTSSGYTAISAANGRHALEQLARTKFDLVISDLTMPEMDGLTLLKTMRADDHYKDLPIIILTASGMDQDRVLACGEGVNGFLTKPFSSWELLEMVNRVLNLADGL